LCDYIGPVSSLILALLTSAVSMLAIWPVSKSIGPFILFSIISGAGNGGMSNSTHALGTFGMQALFFQDSFPPFPVPSDIYMVDTEYRLLWLWLSQLGLLGISWFVTPVSYRHREIFR
jgi:hypothetical protein